MKVHLTWLKDSEKKIFFFLTLVKVMFSTDGMCFEVSLAGRVPASVYTSKFRATGSEGSATDGQTDPQDNAND